MNGEGLVQVASALYSSIGEREYQEDRLVIVEDLNLHIPEQIQVDRRIRRSFYAVFDGHGGDRCSHFLAQTFHLALAAHPEVGRDPRRALHEAWDALDARFYERCLKLWDAIKDPSAKIAANFPRDGSTATVVLLVGNTAYVTNCGDSSAVLVRGGRGAAAATADGAAATILTEDHGTLNRSEVARIIAGGGTLRPQLRRVRARFPCCCMMREVAVGKPRAYPGGLLLTRAFGDFHSKVTELGGVPGTIVNAHGEIREVAVAEGDLLILASDGVWDPIPPPTLTKCLDALRQGGASILGAADADFKRMPPLARECGELVEAAVAHPFWIRFGASADNTSAIMLQFGSGELV